MSWTSMLSELADVGITEAKIDAVIATDPIVRAGVIMMTEKVRDTWQQIWDEAEPVGEHPYETGGYRESIHCEYVTSPRLYGIVRTTDPAAHWIEYGTGPDKKMGSPWGPNTPTPEFAPAQRTIDYFRGSKGDAHFCGPDRTNGGNEVGSVSA